MIANADHDKPVHHDAPVNGRMVTFCNLEFYSDKPPRIIEVDGVRWVREEVGDAGLQGAVLADPA